MDEASEAYLRNYYENHDEDSRLSSRMGQVEFATTKRYIDEVLQGRKCRILELGAGTGRYSIALAKEGHDVTAVELIEHNLDVLKSHLDGTESLCAVKGNALDLSAFADNGFDITLMLGPMYHLYARCEQAQALKEAVRVTKRSGYIFVAYCMNEATVIQYVFCQNNLKLVKEEGMLTEDWKCISAPKDIFQMFRLEDIDELNRTCDVDRVKIVATDGASCYIAGCLNECDEETFGQWLEYHFSTCERKDLIGATNHCLDILRKR